MAEHTNRSGAELQNTAFSWALVLVLAVSVVESLLEGAWLWAGFAAAVVAVALVPAVVARDPSVLVAWEILLLSALPAVANLGDVFVQPLGYLALAALALLVVAEIHAFSSARMAPWFAGLFVVLTTLAVAGVWSMVQFGADAFLATDFLGEDDQLMWDLVAASAVGILAGASFALYCDSQGSVRAMVDGT